MADASAQSPPAFGVVNSSPDLAPEQAQIVVAAANVWLQEVATAYARIAPHVVYYAALGDVPVGTPLFDIVRDGDQPGVLGVHWESAGGVTLGEVYTAPIFAHGGTAFVGAISASAVATHELGEAFRNPMAREWVFGPSRPEGWLYPPEICDPCQAHTYDVDINGVAVAVSDFVTPAWFSVAPSSGPFDRLGKLTAPFTHDPGGYLIVSKDGQGASFVFGDDVPDWRRDVVREHSRIDRAVARDVRRLRP